jgi:Ni,Fe-hydrogenase I large subunit
MATVMLDPITRIEGHLAVELFTGGGNVVTDVQSQGKMFRGFELILANRNPRDAVILTQRICGV